MDDFDPIPRVNPFFRGLVSAVSMVVIALAVWGAVTLAIAALIGAGQ